MRVRSYQPEIFLGVSIVVGAMIVLAAAIIFGLTVGRSAPPPTFAPSTIEEAGPAPSIEGAAIDLPTEGLTLEPGAMLQIHSSIDEDGFHIDDVKVIPPADDVRPIGTPDPAPTRPDIVEEF